MIEQLKLLVRLQTVDKVLFDLNQEKESIPVRLADLSQEEDRLASQLDTQKADLDQVSGRRQELEKENEGIRARVRRAENRLMNSKSQREYRAATAEIEEGKDALKSNEDVLIELMERQEELTGKVNGLQERFDTINAELNQQRKDLSKRSQEVDKEIGKLQGSRKSMCKGVDADLLGQYDFISQRRQGMAMAGVSAGTCLACHMQLPPQQFNELQRQDKVMECPSCRRIIYWADAEGFENL